MMPYHLPVPWQPQLMFRRHTDSFAMMRGKRESSGCRMDVQADRKNMDEEEKV